MESEHLWGIPLMAIGAYFFVCATWKRDFFLYRWKVARAERWYGEKTTHMLYQILGVAAFLGGVAQLVGLFRLRWNPVRWVRTRRLRTNGAIAGAIRW